MFIIIIIGWFQRHIILKSIRHTDSSRVKQDTDSWFQVSQAVHPLTGSGPSPPLPVPRLYFVSVVKAAPYLLIPTTPPLPTFRTPNVAVPIAPFPQGMRLTLFSLALFFNLTLLNTSPSLTLSSKFTVPLVQAPYFLDATDPSVFLLHLILGSFNRYSDDL